VAAPTGKVKAATVTLSSSEEFVQWCKFKLQGLNPGVNQTELLAILLSLPGNADSKEIIADTIYSNSSTMDGRHFAEEFLSRRETADASKTGETWSDVLQRTPTIKPTANDGWNTAFKVVNKKKKRAE
jgi:PERQ amino acid-rich with GYF domain-containing protein